MKQAPGPGKVALITGAAKRLGNAIAQALAAEGFKLVLHAHHSSSEARMLAQKLESNGQPATVLTADLNDCEQAKLLAEQAWQSYGHIDLLINNAAIFYPTSLDALSVETLQTFLNVNLLSPFALSSTLGKQMKTRGSGQIINFTCLSATRAWKNYIPYSISKAALLNLTQGLAKLLAPQVRVNAISPGTVLPPEEQSTEALERLRTQIPLQTLGSPQAIVQAVRYLLANEFVTGENLIVDGGRSLI